jgi:type IV pilus biogenesis protein CpaD/CtpE
MSLWKLPMKTVILLTGVLLAGTGCASDELPEVQSIATRTAHWTLAGDDQSATEPLYDFPISKALGIRIDYKTDGQVEEAEKVEDRRIFSFYIAAAR